MGWPSTSLAVYPYKGSAPVLHVSMLPSRETQRMASSAESRRAVSKLSRDNRASGKFNRLSDADSVLGKGFFPVGERVGPKGKVSSGSVFTSRSCGSLSSHRTDTSFKSKSDTRK